MDVPNFVNGYNSDEEKTIKVDGTDSDGSSQCSRSPQKRKPFSTKRVIASEESLGEEDLQVLRLKVNGRERRRMHDLNTALDGLREVMPYANGPSVRKLSKIATLLLAKNYILMLNSSLEEMKKLVSDVYSNHPARSSTSLPHVQHLPRGQLSVVPGLPHLPQTLTSVNGLPSTLHLPHHELSALSPVSSKHLPHHELSALSPVSSKHLPHHELSALPPVSSKHLPHHELSALSPVSSKHLPHHELSAMSQVSSKESSSGSPSSINYDRHHLLTRLPPTPCGCAQCISTVRPSFPHAHSAHKLSTLHHSLPTHHTLIRK